MHKNWKQQMLLYLKLSTFFFRFQLQRIYKDYYYKLNIKKKLY